jgi:NAD-dependent deacetylase
MTETEFPSDLIASLRIVRRVTVLTGAGISAESGVPTFRDAQTGLWSNFKPEELATPEAFLRNPKLVWEWYAMRRARVSEVSPNPGHHALAVLERRVPEFLLATQNVDGLHHRAGNQNVIELHGNLTRTKCFDENVVVDEWAETGEVPPRCPRCGGLLRPDVVWFNEMLPVGAFENALAAAQRCQVFFSIGTSALVYPAASLPIEALNAGALVVEVNPQETPLTRRAAHFLQGPSGRVLPALMRAVWPEPPVS